jgi:hypothetical protein
MATISLAQGDLGLTNAVLDNSITAAFGITTSTAKTPSQFLTHFGSQSIFTPSSHASTIRAMNNWDVIFHWHPESSQIRKYLSLAFQASDTGDLPFYIRKINIPAFKNDSKMLGYDGMRGSIPGLGINGEGDSFQIFFLNTDFSIVHHCFYQWLRETENDEWIYTKINNPSVQAEDDTNVEEQVPFTKADIEIVHYSSGTNEKMHSITIFGAFPNSIQNLPVGNESSELWQPQVQVSFAYDNICVESPFSDANWSSKIVSNVLADYLNKSILSFASRKLNSLTNSVGGKISDSLLNTQKKIGVGM